LFAAVAKNDAVAAAVAAFHSARMGLEVIDLPEMAQRNVAALFEDENRGLAFLVFYEQSALLTFTYQGELFGLRRIEVGARQLQESSEERREQLADRVVLELQRSIDGVDRQFSSITLSRMVVAFPPDCGMEEKMRDGLYIPFEAMDLAKVMDLTAVPELADPEMQRRSLKSIGAALRFEDAPV
jgi:MSHA biogenesis protein MshI